MQTIKTWRFDPATRNDEPVAVAMNSIFIEQP
jgi:hypothetical protein